MDIRNRLVLPLNLQQFSIITIGIKFWELPSVKKKVQEYFCDTVYSFFCKSFSIRNFNKITEKVIQQLKGIHLPEKILMDIQNVIYYLGEQIFHWTKFVILKLRLPFEYAENIIWTTYGTIDKGKIFELYWGNNSELLSSYKSSDCTEGSVYSLACIFAQEKFISGNLNTMRQILKNFSGTSLNTGKNINKHFVISLWICYYIGGSKKKGIQLYKNLKEKTNNPNAKLMSMCASSGYFDAVKYFAKNLTKGKDKHFFWCAEDTLAKMRDPNSQTYRKGEYARILIYLINGMSEGRRISYLTTNLPDLFFVFINMKFYQELLLPLFDWVFHNMTEEDKPKLLDVIITQFEFRDSTKENVVGIDICREVLQNLLETLPTEVKKNKLGARYLSYKLIELPDYTTLKMILNDTDMMDCRAKMLSLSETVFRSFVQRGEFECLNEFSTRILKDEEKKEFKNQFNYLQEFATLEKYELADRLLNWMTDSVEEKVQLKKKINSAKICLALHEEKRFDTVKIDKLLKWQYDSDEEQIKQAKIAIRSDNLVCNEFCFIWCSNCFTSLEQSVKKCSEFLTWFFEAEDVQNLFIQQKLVENENFIKLFCSYLYFPKDLVTIDELFKFCKISPDAVECIKRNIIDDIDNWIELYGINQNNFRMLESIVNWIVKDEDEKINVIKKVLSSSKIIRLCCNVVGSCNASFYDPILIFFNLWLKPYGNIQNITYETCSKSGRYISEVICLLNILENHGIITPHDIKRSIFYRS